MFKKTLGFLTVAMLPLLAYGATRTAVMKQEEGQTERSVQMRSSDPGAPVSDQLWLNKSEGAVKYYDGISTKSISGGAGGGGGGVNLLETGDNPGFEADTAGWTASGGSFTIESSTPLFGTKSALFDASALNQTLSSSAKSVKEGLKGQSCLAMISYQFTGAAGDYKLQVYDGTTVLAEQSLNPATSPDVGLGYVGFQCPTSGTVLVRVIAGVSNPAVIKLDGPSLAGGLVQLGSNIMLAQVANAEFYGSVNTPATASCQWIRTAGTYGSFAADSDCPVATASGKASAPGTKIPAITFPSLPKGEYVFVAVGHHATNGNPNDYSRWRFYDGTTQLIGETKVQTTSSNGFIGSQEITGYLTNPTDRTNVTVELQCLISTPGQNCYTQAVQQAFSIIAIKLPTTASTVVSGIETSAAYWSGFFANDCAWSQNNAAPYADPAADASCTLTDLTPATGIGAVTKAGGGSTLPGITFTPKKLGVYEVCASVAVYNDTGGNAGFLRLYDGTNVLGYTSSYYHGSSGGKSVPLCGFYNATSLSPATIKIQAYTTAGTNLIYNAGGLEPVVSWTVKAISNQFPQPYYAIKSVSSNADNERTERLQFGGASEISNCTSSPCTIYRQSGSWVSSVTRSGTGSYTVNIASGIFSALPTCVISPYIVGGSSFYFTAGATSTTSVTVTTRDSTTSNADAAISMICMGPK